MRLFFNNTLGQFDISCLSRSNMDEDLEFSEVTFEEEEGDDVEAVKLIRRLSTLHEVR